MDFKEIRDLFDVRDDSFGFSEEEVAARENHLGTKLPEVLRRYYPQLGKNKQIDQTRDSSVAPSELEIDPDGFLVIYHENQRVWRAAVKAADFGHADPPVYLSYDREKWNFEIGRLFNFLTAEAYFVALFALPFCANGIDVGGEKENRVRQNRKASEFKSALWGTFFFKTRRTKFWL